MMIDFAPIIMSLLPSLLVSMFMAFFSRAQKRRDEKIEARANARKRESLLGLEMQFAGAKLAFATAKALKEGKTNGEVTDSMETFAAAKKKYVDFLNEQAAENIYK